MIFSSVKIRRALRFLLVFLISLFIFFLASIVRAERSNRDIMGDELDAISQTIEELNLDDNIKLENGKTHYEIVNDFLDKAKDKIDDDAVSDDKARWAIQAVQQAIVNPHLAEDSPPVPKGEIFEDLIPQLIKLAFYVAWVAVFVSFLVSGILMVFAMESEDRLVKAKNILYYSLIGFAVITLAFAIVKAVTDIDFFGFV